MTNELAAMSIILVFVTVAFSLIIPSVWDELGNRIDNYEKSDDVKTRTLKAINSMLFLKVLPLAFSFLILGYILTPTTCSIIVKSDFDLWDFDLLNTLSVVINILIYIMTVVLVITFIKLLGRRKSLKIYFE